LTNPDPCASGGVCGETDDAGEVEAEWGEASGVSRGEEWYGGTAGLGTTGASLGKGTRGANAGIEELTLPVLWCVNGAGTG
jgi:hypothetical protein